MDPFQGFSLGLSFCFVFNPTQQVHCALLWATEVGEKKEGPSWNLKLWGWLKTWPNASVTAPPKQTTKAHLRSL